MLARGDDGLPDGRRITPPPPGPWDDCFEGITAPTVLEWPGVLRLSIDSDAEYVVVYDEQPGAVCVEPQTAPPNDLAFMVEPGRPFVASDDLAVAAALTALPGRPPAALAEGDAAEQGAGDAARGVVQAGNTAAVFGRTMWRRSLATASTMALGHRVRGR